MRVLRPATTIPPELYVEREADRQLRRVLEDMGRPAYVLVARQMGKTNLLLHAKRALEDTQNVFLYLDLSGVYRSARECFRAIVDTAVETHPQSFAGLAERFSAERNRRDLPPHKEHEIELRSLLGCISGKLVIILDEIDALTRCDYSDHIFSQIRSTYFSRVNFREYHRLTYVLSGVAEPTEIIKNPNLSPFNIGEKIYLDDFTEAEFRKFVAGSRLQADEESLARVYYWTAGHPRLTWDICSELEEESVRGHAVSVEVVDRCVSKLYLTSFDRPPVDHIRSLVASDKPIRGAVLLLRSFRAPELGAAIRGRLFLAGIIKADIRKVEIKNKIIDAALSAHWLREIEVQKAGALDTALDAIAERRFDDAVQVLTEHLAGTSADEKGARLGNYYLGLARMGKEEYERAIPHLEASLCSDDRAALPGVWATQLLKLAQCYAYAGKWDAAQLRFEEILAGPVSRDWKLRAMLPLATIHQAMDPAASRDRILDYCRMIIEEAPAHEAAMGRDGVARLRTAARVTLSESFRLSGEVSVARQTLAGAAAEALAEERPYVLLQEYRLEEDPAQRARLMEAMVEAIVVPGLDVRDRRAEAPFSFSAEVLREILFIMHASGRGELFERVLDATTSSSSSPGRRRVEIILSLARGMLAKKEYGSLETLGHVLWKEVQQAGVSGRLREDAVRLVAFGGGFRDQSVFSEYMWRFEETGAGGSLDGLDMLIMIRAAQALQSSGSHVEALNALRPARAVRAEPLFEHSVVAEFLAMESHAALGQRDLRRQAAGEILRRGTRLRVEPAAGKLLDRDTLRLILRTAESEMRRTASDPPRRVPGIGRNQIVRVRYPDGRIASGKYKRLEADIEAGRCTLVQE